MARCDVVFACARPATDAGEEPQAERKHIAPRANKRYAARNPRRNIEGRTNSAFQFNFYMYTPSKWYVKLNAGARRFSTTLPQSAKHEFFSCNTSRIRENDEGQPFTANRWLKCHEIFLKTRRMARYEKIHYTSCHLDVTLL